MLLWVGLVALQAHRIATAARSLQSSVDQARSDVRAPAGDGQSTVARVAEDLAVVQARARALDAQTRGIVWRSGRHLPGLSGAVRETDALAAGASDLASQVLPAYLQLARSASTIRAANGDVNVGLLRQQAAPVAAATQRLDALVTKLAAVPSGGVRPLDNARSRLLTAMAELQGYGRTATTTLRVAPALLGADGPRTTLVILESPAESRPGGGLVGGYVLLRADHGHLSTVGSGTNHDLASTAQPVISLGPQYDALYGGYGAEQVWVKSTLSPDFPKTAQIWAALFHAQYGITPDAEIGLTPHVLDDLLSVTGPITLPGGKQVHAGQADHFLQIGLYEKFPTFADESARNDYQLAFLKKTISAVLADHVDPTKLLQPLGPQVDSGALRLHVTDQAAQQLVAATPLGGALPTTPGPFYGVFTTSTDGTKLGAYLAKTVSYRRSEAAGGTQTGTLDVALTNTAPTSGLPAYVDTRFLPSGQPGAGPGSHQFELTIYLATDARDPVVSVNGTRVMPLVTAREEGHLLVTVFPPPLPGGGGKETVTVSATEPASTAAPGMLRQPSLIPTTYRTQPPG